MRTVILVIFWLELIGFIGVMISLGLGNYPRVVEWTRGEHAISATLKALVAALLAWMLWA